MSIYQTNPDAPADSAFEPASLHHLVVGNEGRLLDARRTPVSVVDIRLEVGLVTLRIEDFEDRGAQWEVPFEDVSFYQFARGAMRAEAADVESFERAVARFDRPMTIACDPETRAGTEAKLSEEREAAGSWLGSSSRFLREGGELPDPATRVGDPRLFDDLRAYMASRGLWDVEDAFARRYVTNPGSGELVKGHRIVIAELGLVPYEGKVVRDPALFDGAWSRERRAEHAVARLGFAGALFARTGHRRVILYRGTSTEDPLEPARNKTFVSATFSRDVAESHFDSGGPSATRAIWAQTVPVERVFMTYLETASMNAPFREAEAVLLFDGSNAVF